MSTLAPTRLALCLLATFAIAGCGKAPALDAPPLTIDSAFTRTPAQDAGQVVAKQRQDQKDATAGQTDNNQGGGTDEKGNGQN